MKRYEIARQIAAPPQIVLSILTDEILLQTGGFGIRAIDGHIAKGGTFKLWTDADPNRTFVLRVTEFDPPHRMVWQGGMPLGLFRGTRTFDMAPSDGGTAFSMTEQFSGLLAGPICRAMPDLTPSFETFADALKRHSEERA